MAATLSSSHKVGTSSPSDDFDLRNLAICNSIPCLEVDKAPPEIQIMVEFLCNHDLNIPLTKQAQVPISLIQRAYHTARYFKEEDCVEFNADAKNSMKVDKSKFLMAIGFPNLPKEERNIKEPTKDELFDMLEKMNYSGGRLENISDFLKAKLPAVWQYLCHILFRCLSGRIGGTHRLKRGYLSILYGLYYDKDVDIGDILWKDFATFIEPKKAEIRCGRFWGLILKLCYKELNLEMPKGELAVFRTIMNFTVPISNQSPFGVVNPIPEDMLKYIPKTSMVLSSYLKVTETLKRKNEEKYLEKKREIGEKKKTDKGQGGTEEGGSSASSFALFTKIDNDDRICLDDSSTEGAKKSEENMASQGNSEGLSKTRKRSKGRHKRGSKNVSKKKFKQMEKTLNEVLEFVRHIPTAADVYTPRADFTKLLDTVTSLSRTVEDMNARQLKLHDEMSTTMTKEAMIVIDKFNVVVNAVNNWQKVYDSSVNSFGKTYVNEINRFSAQNLELRKQNIVLHSVVVKVLKSLEILEKPTPQPSEVLSILSGMQTTVEELSKQLSSEPLKKHLDEGFAKLFALMTDPNVFGPLHGKKSINAEELEQEEKEKG